MLQIVSHKGDTMKRYVITKQTLDMATIAIGEAIDTLMEDRGNLCLEDAVLLYKLMGTRNELYKIQLDELYAETIEANYVNA